MDFEETGSLNQHKLTEESTRKIDRESLFSYGFRINFQQIHKVTQ